MVADGAAFDPIRHRTFLSGASWEERYIARISLIRRHRVWQRGRANGIPHKLLVKSEKSFDLKRLDFVLVL
jgi:hypothetical protein